MKKQGSECCLKSFKALLLKLKRVKKEELSPKRSLKQGKVQLLATRNLKDPSFLKCQCYGYEKMTVFA